MVLHGGFGGALVAEKHHFRAAFFRDLRRKQNTYTIGQILASSPGLKEYRVACSSRSVCCVFISDIASFVIFRGARSVPSPALAWLSSEWRSSSVKLRTSRTGTCRGFPPSTSLPTGTTERRRPLILNPASTGLPETASGE